MSNPTAREECLKALQALYLEVDATIANDIQQKVIAALNEATLPAGEAEGTVTTLTRSLGSYGLHLGDIPDRAKTAVFDAMRDFAHTHTAKAVEDCKRGLVEKATPILNGLEMEVTVLEEYLRDADSQEERLSHSQSLREVKATIGGIKQVTAWLAVE